MAKKIMNLNVASLALIGENTQVRMRIRNGDLQIRPSARVISTNLPEGEVMRPVSFKRDGDKVRGAVVNIRDLGGEEFFETGTAFELSQGKYGWLNASIVAEPAKGAAYGRVSVK